MNAVPSSLPVGPTHDELTATLDPFVSERFSIADPRWASLLTARQAKILRAGPRPGPDDRAPVPEGESPVQTVDRATRWLSEKFRTESGNVAIQWGEHALLAKGMGLSRVYLLALMRLVERFAPASVAEVGFGSGINLFALAARFPSIHFSGIEINGDAVMRARALQRVERLPDVIRTFSPEPVLDLGAHRRVALQVGDAGALPFKAKSVDFVFTKLALERMQPFQRIALGELRRVARYHVVMVEAFRDWNNEGVRRDYIVAQRYFDCALDDLSACGLQPVHVLDDLPHKITHRPVVVVARPAALDASPDKSHG
jgi:SAM-dependent methyltransferase